MEIEGLRLTCEFSPEPVRQALQFVPRSGDVVLVTYPKCGTHWVQQILQLVVNRGRSAENFFEWLVRTPLLELPRHAHPGWCVRAPPDEDTPAAEQDDTARRSEWQVLRPAACTPRALAAVPPKPSSPGARWTASSKAEEHGGLFTFGD
ncbi:hypothetical protein MRX96_034420 [Rhipicephalus microplus]